MSADADIRLKIGKMLEARMSSRLDVLMRYYARDVVFHVGSSRWGQLGPGTWHGVEAVRSIMRLSDENYRPLDHEILDIVVDGAQAAVRWRGDWRRHATGKVYSIDAAHFLRWENDVVVEMHEFFQPASAPTPLQGMRYGVLSDRELASGLERDDIAESVRRLIGFQSNGPEIERIREFCAPNIVCDFVGDRSRIPYAGRYMGIDALISIVKAVALDFEQSHFDIKRMLIDGGRVAGVRSVQWRHRGTRRSGTVDLANFVRFEDGKVVELIEFRDGVTLSDMRGDDPYGFPAGPRR